MDFSSMQDLYSGLARGDTIGSRTYRIVILSHLRNLFIKS